MANRQSFWWYVPIVLVMLLGYSFGGSLVFGLHFLKWCPSLANDTARFTLKLFGMGMLGSTMRGKWCQTYTLDTMNIKSVKSVSLTPSPLQTIRNSKQGTIACA